MDIGTISKRYAKALLLYAEECEAEERVYQQVLTLSHHLMQVKELGKALLNPVLADSVKMSLLAQAVGGTMDEVLTRFIGLLFKQRRERHLLFILHSFVGLYRRKKKIYVSQLTTAAPLDKATEERMRRMMARVVTGTVEFEARVDESLRGGFVLQMDHLRMDASVAGQLRQVRKELVN